MELTFLTPLAGCFALAALLPLAVHLGRERRAREVRAALALSARSRPAGTPLALTLIPALLGLAATQPVLERAQTRPARTDAQAFFVIDTSRSMLASSAPVSQTRLERARRAAISLQQSLDEVPAGLAVFTERMLPYVFPTTDSGVFAAVLADSMGIERPRPLSTLSFAQQATTLDALAAVPTANYYAPSARRRLLVVLTDGETRDVTSTLARASRGRRRIETLIVRFWDSDERVYVTGVAEPGYKPDATSHAKLARAASLLGANVYGERELGAATAAAERFLGSGPKTPRTFEAERVALMPYVVLAALLPLAFVLWRRNV
jgi:hypothetical protein